MTTPSPDHGPDPRDETSPAQAPAPDAAGSAADLSATERPAGDPAPEPAPFASPAPEAAAPAPEASASPAPPASDAAPSAPAAAVPAPAPQDPYAASRDYAAGVQADPYAAPAPADAAGPQGGAPAGEQSPFAQDAYPQAAQQGHGAGSAPGQVPPFAGQPQGAPSGTQWSDAPPAGVKGAFAGPLTGEATTAGESKTWAMLAQLSVIIGHLVSIGFLGWVGPLIIFLMYKDRSRFVRFHAAEALNGAIAVLICSIVLGVAASIFTVITLGLGAVVFPLVGVPALVQLIFSIIAAVKANQGAWWNYPLNIRLVS